MFNRHGCLKQAQAVVPCCQRVHVALTVTLTPVPPTMLKALVSASIDFPSRFNMATTDSAARTFRIPVANDAPLTRDQRVSDLNGRAQHP